MLRSIYRVNSSFQTNIASFSTLFHNGALKLVRCAGRDLECFEVEVLPQGNISIHSLPIRLDALPPFSRLVAVHCFTQRMAGSRPVPLIGVLSLSGDGDDTSFAVHIFGATCRETSPSLQQLANECQTLELDFVPCLLHSVVVPPDVAAEHKVLPGAFLVSGSCKELRVLAQRADSKKFEWLGAAARESIPCLPSRSEGLRLQVLAADIRQVGAVEVAAYGCVDGSLVVAVDGVEHSVHLEGPISAVSLFSRPAGRSARQQLWPEGSLVRWSPEPPDAIDWGGIVRHQPATAAATALSHLLQQQAAQPRPPTCSLVVAGATGYALVFRNVLQRGLEPHPVLLSGPLDSVLSVAVADFNSDGRDEILLGTHDGLLHVYQQHDDDDDVWRHADTIDLGSAPIHCAAVLRSIDVAPYLLLCTEQSLELLAPPLRVMEQALIKSLDELAQKSQQPNLTTNNAE